MKRYIYIPKGEGITFRDENHRGPRWRAGILAGLLAQDACNGGRERNPSSRSYPVWRREIFTEAKLCISYANALDRLGVGVGRAHYSHWRSNPLP